MPTSYLNYNNSHSFLLGFGLFNCKPKTLFAFIILFSIKQLRNIGNQVRQLTLKLELFLVLSYLSLQLLVLVHYFSLVRSKHFCLTFKPSCFCYQVCTFHCSKLIINVAEVFKVLHNRPSRHRLHSGFMDFIFLLRFFSYIKIVEIRA